MPTATQIIHVRLDDDAAADDAVGANELDLSVLDIHMGHSILRKEKEQHRQQQGGK